MKGTFFAGDVRASPAVTNEAQSLLGYVHSHLLGDGICEAMP